MADDDIRQHHSALLDAHVKLAGARRALADARRQLHEHAAKQLDSMPHAIRTIEDHVERDKAGGILGHRALRAKLTERGRLQNIVFPALDPDHDDGTP